jgi:nitrogen fixation NifU-like protein
VNDPTPRYSKVILDHFLNPRNAGALPDANAVGEVGAAVFGDVMKLSLRIRDGRIEAARFQAFGCGTAIATASAMTVLIQGRTVDEALKLSNQQIIDELGGLPPEKVHCSMLAEEAVKAAVQDYWKRQPQGSRPAR